MDYRKIHDALIARASIRIYDSSIHHKHHVVPRHEDLTSTETVPLTIKEHALVHKLRYKMGFGAKNLKAYLLLSQRKDYTSWRSVLSEFGKLGASSYHNKFKHENYSQYLENQSSSGYKGGMSSLKNKKGFFSLSEEDISKCRDKGRRKTIELKLGMFNDEFRKVKHEKQQKKVKTPDGLFNSMYEASIYYDIVPASITYRVKSNSETWKEWSYI